MQRPVMNPTYHDDAPAPARQQRWGLWLKVVVRAMRITLELLLSNPFRLRDPSQLRNEVGTPTGRFVRGLFYRLAFVPLIAAAVAALLVYAGTHPSVPLIDKDPITVGVYYDPVTFANAEGNRLEGWLVPVIDAKKVVEERENVLRIKWPAVVLVHDYAESRQQMLPLVRPLHEAGFVVLVTSLRGDGSSGEGGHTFGLHESNDVLAAVELLRRRPFVDASRIAVLGLGTGAIAATFAVERDAQIGALVSLRPPDGSDLLLHRHVIPKRMPWIAPLCEWTFEIAYGVDANDLNSSARTGERSGSTLLIRNAGSLEDTGLTERVVDHLYRHLQQVKTADLK